MQYDYPILAYQPDNRLLVLAGVVLNNAYGDARDDGRFYYEWNGKTLHRVYARILVPHQPGANRRSEANATDAADGQSRERR